MNGPIGALLKGQESIINTPINDTINDLVDGKYFILDNHYNSICDHLSNVNKQNYSKFSSIYDSSISTNRD